MTSIAMFPLLLLIIGVVILLPILLVCLLRARGQKQTPSVQSIQPESSNPAERNSKREAILNQLAAKEITREDAEQQLIELDNPVPDQMPIAPPPPRKGCGMGCLIAFVVGSIALFLLMLCFFGLRATSIQHESSIINWTESQEAR